MPTAPTEADPLTAVQMGINGLKVRPQRYEFKIPSCQHFCCWWYVQFITSASFLCFKQLLVSSLEG